MPLDLMKVVVWLTPAQVAELNRRATEAGDKRSAHLRRILTDVLWAGGKKSDNENAD